MTVATKDLSTGSAKPWKRLWQVPLLLVGLVAFGYGVRAIVKTVKPVPFEEQVTGIRGLLAGEKYDQAIEQINVLGNYYQEKGQEGTLNLLAGDAHYLAQEKQPVLVVENYQRVLEHYEKAEAMGVVPDVGMNERWGIAALAIGRAGVAMEKLEAAIRAEPGLVQKHARDLVVAYLGAGQKDKAREVLGKLLAEHGEEEGVKGMRAVDDRTWALCKKVEIAISEKGPGNKELVKTVGEVEEALKGIPERDPSGRVLTWIGRAKLELGDVEGARADLKEARGRFLMKHLDDGRAAVLLAKIAEAKGELKEAEGLYRQVVMTHAGTPVWAAARLGRADVGVKLSYEKKMGKVVESLEAFGPGTTKVVEGDGRSGGTEAERVVPAVSREEKEGEVKGAKEEGKETGKELEPTLPGMTPGEVADYRYAIATVTAKTSPLEGSPELIDVGQVKASLVAGYERATEKGNLDQALSYLALAKELDGNEDEAMAYRMAVSKERQAAALLEAGKGKEARQASGEAAEEYRQHAKLAAMEDGLAGNSLWKAAQLFDQAGRVKESLEAYELFTVQRPKDPRVAEGLLAMARLQQSAGQWDESVKLYQRTMKDFPRTPAAYAAAVEVSRCYMGMADAMPRVKQGDEEKLSPEAKALVEKAEQGLLALVQNSGDLLPEANEFRMSLFALGELYYRNGRWADAILRLEEAVERYPEDKGVPRALYMLAQCYRRSAADIGRAIAKDPTVAGRDALEAARMDRLMKAAGLLTRVIGMLDVPTEGGHGKARTALEEEYLRSSYMDRAACTFDRGEYGQAIKLYDETAMRFAEEAVAVQAYVQIVNGYLAQKQQTQANAAAERGRWILRRIPEEAFAAPSPGREYYEKLLALGKN